ncbi:putative transport protein USO1 [Podospora fimiseda]|uniref:Transport protein USO1 n=1 Tax=Podospora fimiseda TaxID=252190 RepID=A0AAN7BPY3_9PEZI|nr:putative transport protein USO1 [Podospora fimiseda]
MFSTITAAPAKQSVSETIPILSGRLSTSTLLEDRRAAILGLRSFAKQYPASVASGALRSLIGSLDRDGEDVDTVKVVLETLLMLFNPDPDSPEASEEIALWVADEFTQRHENIGLLLGFLDKERLDFYSRLYSLQLLSAILSARTERTEECIVNAPDGIARIVAALDEQREAIRDEAVGLLTDLTPTSTVIQGLVAFENVFGRIFSIINTEGGLAFGARVVEDCLILLANLLRLNTTNQAMFRDMGFVAEVGRLLNEAYGGDNSGEQVSQWVEVQRNRNVYAILAVIRLFLVPGAAVTAQNQEAFLGDLIQTDRNGRGGHTSRARNTPILVETLQIVFSHNAELQIKSEALYACADMIRGNRAAQEAFSGIHVPFPLEVPAVNGNGIPTIGVIEALLHLVLGLNALQAFDLRLAACVLLKAYFYKHEKVQHHFLDFGIGRHQANEDEHTNVLTILLRPTPESLVTDPYQCWFAAIIMLHLLNGNPEAKALAMSVTEGDEASGEEVVTSIQTIAAHFLSSVAKSEDPRVSIGYLMLLLCWLFENPKGVDDFLDEFTNLQGLIQAAIENPNGDVLVQGLSAMLAGVVYEFSTRDSPVPRVTVREMIMTRMTRDRYIDKLSKLRSHPLMRDFEVLPQKLEPGLDSRLPDVFFDETFVEFFKDNYSRILRAIDRDPDFEASVLIDGVHRMVSRTLVEDLTRQITEKEEEFRALKEQVASLIARLASEQEAHKQTKSFQSADMARRNETLNEMQGKLGEKEREIQTIKTVKEREVQAEKARVANLERQLAAERGQHQSAKAELVRITAELGVKTRLVDSAEAQAKTLNKQLEVNKSVVEKLRQDNKVLEGKVEQGKGLLEEEKRKLREQLKIREDELQKELAASRKAWLDEQERNRLEVERVRKSVEEEKQRGMQEVERANKATEQVRRKLEAELADSKATVSRLEVDLMKADKVKGEGERKVKELEEKLRKEEGVREGLEKKVRELEKKGEEGSSKVDEGELKKKVEEVKKKEEERKAAQEELDDLLMVFGDLEEKVKGYKERLKALGETVSDGEDDDDDEEEDEK